MRITPRKLKSWGACCEARRRFKRMFPNGCALNEKNILRWMGGQTLARWSWGRRDVQVKWVAHWLGVGRRYRVATDRGWSERDLALYAKQAAAFFKRELAKRRKKT